MNYKESRSWSDRYMPSVKSIIGQEVVKISTYEQDTEQATDLIIKTTNTYVACRVRDYNKYQKYEHQFTIRSRSDYGQETEIHKISKGFADWMFYGFGDGNDKVVKYSIIDLDVFRQNYRLNQEGEVVVDKVFPHSMNNVGNDNTGFLVFELGAFPQNIIVNNCSNINIQFGLEKVSQYLLPF